MSVSILASCFDIVWPRVCEICGKASDRPRRHICADCLNRLPLIAPNEGYYEIPDAVCALRFEAETRQMVLDFKFNRHLWLKDDFADFIEAAASARFPLAEVDAVIPMPTTILHRIDRGYNQCDYLAGSLARRIDRKCLARALYRCNSPKRQSSLGEDERSANVKGTIGVRRSEYVRGRTLLVVDDIMTTGSTLAECSKVLREAGAYRVWSVALARSAHT